MNYRVGKKTRCSILFVISWMNVYEGYSTSAESGPITVCVCNTTLLLNNNVLYQYYLVFNILLLFTEKTSVGISVFTQMFLDFCLGFVISCVEYDKIYHHIHPLKKQFSGNLYWLHLSDFSSLCVLKSLLKSSAYLRYHCVFPLYRWW